MMLWTPLFPTMCEKGNYCTGWINFGASNIKQFMLQLCKAALIYLHSSLAPTPSLLAPIMIDRASLFWDKDIADFKQREL